MPSIWPWGGFEVALGGFPASKAFWAQFRGRTRFRRNANSRSLWGPRRECGQGGSRGGRGSTRYDLTIVKQKRTLRTRWRICSPLRCRWKCFPTASPAAGNPNGILSLSPGLRGTSYPGVFRGRPRNHERVISGRCAWHVERRGYNTFRVEVLWHGLPRVARSSLPWAERWHPFRMKQRECLGQKRFSSRRDSWRAQATARLRSACSSTASTCSRVTPGNQVRNSFTVAPSSKFSNKVRTGTRVALNTQAPLTFPGTYSTAAH